MTTATLASEINNLVQNHTDKDNNSIDIENKMASILAERNLDRNIAEARKEYEEGKGVVLNEKYINNLTTQLAQE